jgi:uncharacterized protein (TIGR03435 family)
MKPAIVTIVLVASTAAPSAQQAAPQRSFDVISIRPSPPATRNGLPRISPGRVEIYNQTLKGLIRMAYSRFAFDPREIVGGPSWIDSERFDIVATMEPSPDVDSSGLPAGLVVMLRSLVEDRFRVKTHNEQREALIYALVLARSDKRTGAGLRTVADECAESMKALTSGKPVPPRGGPPPCSFGGSPGKLVGTGVTTTMFANVLSGT